MLLLWELSSVDRYQILKLADFLFFYRGGWDRVSEVYLVEFFGPFAVVVSLLLYLLNIPTDNPCIF